MIFRPLLREEIAHIWEIDRAEVIDNVYCLRDGRLVLEPEHYDMRGWPPGEAKLYTPILLDCYDRGGTFLGARKLYVSATPSEHTIGFYMRLGCVLASEPDPELWELEPEDIHLERVL